MSSRIRFEDMGPSHQAQADQFTARCRDFWEQSRGTGQHRKRILDAAKATKVEFERQDPEHWKTVAGNWRAMYATEQLLIDEAMDVPGERLPEHDRARADIYARGMIAWLVYEFVQSGKWPK